MKKSLPILGLVLLLGISGIANATSLSQTPALFETYVSSTQGTSDTTLNIASPTLSDGTSVSGYVCVTVDSNTPSVEYECGNLTSNTIAVTARGLNYQNGTTTITSLKKVHRTGADVKITEYPTLAIIQRILSGLDVLESTIAYDNIATTTVAANRNNLATVGLVQDTAFNGAGVINASATNKGVVQLSTAAQAAASIASGSSGAFLVVPNSIATSTYNAATSVNVIPVTGSLGTIDQGFLPASTTKAMTFASSTYIGSTYAFDIGKHEQVFTSSSTWAVPVGVHTVFARVQGAGGNSGTGSIGFSSGGGGGYTEGFINVTSTTTLAIVIGVEGSATTSSDVSLTGFTGPFVLQATVGSTGNGTNSSNQGSGTSAVGGIGIGGTLVATGTPGFPYYIPTNAGFVFNPSNGGDGMFGSTYGYGGSGSSAAPGANGVVVLQW